MKLMFIKVTVCFIVITTLFSNSVLVNATENVGTVQKSKPKYNYVDINKPSIISVMTTLEADITFNEAFLHEQFSERMQKQFASSVSSIEEDFKPEEKNEAYTSKLLEIFKKSLPNNILFAYESQTKNVKVIKESTGFFINPKGNIVTSASAVYVDEKDLIINTYEKVFESFINEYKIMTNTYAMKEYMDIPENVYNELKDEFFSLVKTRTKVENKKISYTSIDISGETTNMEIIIAGEPFPGNDISILKVETDEHPTVFISKETSSINEHATASMLLLDEDGKRKSHDFLISRKLSNIEGQIPVYLIKEKHEKKSSGSPVVDEYGRFIGVLKVLPFETDYEKSGGNTVIIPAENLYSLLGETDVKIENSEFTILYRNAVKEYQNEGYENCISLLNSAQKLYSKEESINYMIRDAEKFIAQGASKTDEKMSNMNDPNAIIWLVFLFIILILLIYILCKMVKLHKIKKKRELRSKKPHNEKIEPAVREAFTRNAEIPIKKKSFDVNDFLDEINIDDNNDIIVPINEPNIKEKPVPQVSNTMPKQYKQSCPPQIKKSPPIPPVKERVQERKRLTQMQEPGDYLDQIEREKEEIRNRYNSAYPREKSSPRKNREDINFLMNTLDTLTEKQKEEAFSNRIKNNQDLDDENTKEKVNQMIDEILNEVRKEKVVSSKDNEFSYDTNKAYEKTKSLEHDNDTKKVAYNFINDEDTLIELENKDKAKSKDENNNTTPFPSNNKRYFY